MPSNNEGGNRGTYGGSNRTVNTNRVGAARWTKVGQESSSKKKPSSNYGRTSTYGASGAGTRSSDYKPKPAKAKPPKPPKPPKKWNLDSSNYGSGVSTHGTSRSDRGNNPPGGGHGRGGVTGRETSKTSPTDWAKAQRIQNGAARRSHRIAKGIHRGKYYGPDQFKGNTKMIDAWKRTGKKGSRMNPTAFAQQYNRGANR